MGFIETTADAINTSLEGARPPLQPLPIPLVPVGAQSRPGLSAIALTSAVISRLPEAGIETGVNPDGSPNVLNMFIRILCEEIVKEIKDNAKVSIGLMPGTVISTGTGASAAGPVTVVSTSTTFTGGYGIVE